MAILEPISNNWKVKSLILCSWHRKRTRRFM